MALRELCDAYWRPLYAFVRRRGSSPADAEDVVQGFLTSMLATSGLAAVDRDRGRFRSYLLAAFQHFMSAQRARAQAQKRGGGQVPVPLHIDTDDAERVLDLTDGRTPEQAYAHAWALEILGRARTRLRSTYEKEGNEARFDALAPFLGTAEVPPYRAVATQLSMTEANARVAVHRLRGHFRSALRDEVAETVSTAAEIDDELRAVIEALGT